MDETIDLREIFGVLKKNIKLIIIMIILAVGLSAGITYYFITPIYQASTQILVNPKQSDKQSQIQAQDIQTNLQLINTYAVIIKSPTILSKVIDDLDLNTSISGLSSKITVSNESNSQVINITVKDESAAEAVYIANSVASVFQSEIKKLMDVDNVNVLAPAELSANPVPVSPNKKLNIIAAALAGLVIGIALAFLREFLDTTVKTEKDIEELLNLPILGQVSRMSDTYLGLSETVKTRRAVRREG